MPDNLFLDYIHDAAHRPDFKDNLDNHIHYTLDAMGNRTQQDINDPNDMLVQTHSRVYDSLNQLDQVA